MPGPSVSLSYLTFMFNKYIILLNTLLRNGNGILLLSVVFYFLTRINTLSRQIRKGLTAAYDDT